MACKYGLTCKPSQSGKTNGRSGRSSGDVAGRVVSVAARYGAANASLFVNGCPQATHAAVAASGAGIAFGTRGNEMGRFFRGALGEVVVFSRALEAGEMAEMQAYLAAAWPLAPTARGVCPEGGGGVGFAVSQAYAVSRFMNAAQSRVVVPGTPHQPVKFNGLGWTSSRPSPVINGSATCAPGSPDCRQ